MKQLEVQIMGQSYLLGCPENGDARLLEAVSRVDAAMCKIRDAGKTKARDRIAVLAALNLAFELPDRAANGAALAAPAAAPLQLPTDSLDATSQASQPQLAALLQRLDTALGIDGRLL
ncbi:MAG: cell division protein ZapA [Polaromonas sp.]